MIKEAVLLAAEQVGDKDGKDGLVGYLRDVAVTDPRTFCTLLRRIIPLQVQADPQTFDLLQALGLPAPRKPLDVIDLEPLNGEGSHE